MNEELDSQLSAMFDDELPAAECELLARRLSRDEQLKARWGRYAVIGATIRAEGGVRLNAGLAGRVSAAISSEAPLTAEPAPQPKKRWDRGWWQPLAGVAAAAGVAAVSIIWMRSQVLPDTLPAVAQTVMPAISTANTPVATTVASATARGNTSEPDSYVVPKNSPRRLVVPSTELANYVVAHSEFSSPVTRRNLLSAFMASESGTAGTSAGSEEPTEDVQDDAKNPQ
ncbi:MAG TPA: sigma-E factor negative regulatory protein [Steroidobacteraceae bacterium]|nr:sigma-E factor negative regulatory protein [Steroidobacteraceae bacterium]